MDRIAASKVYKGKDYTDACAWEYFERGRDFVVMHPRTKYQLEYLLTMLKEQGEERTFAFIRALLARERAKEQAVREKTDGTRDPGDKRAWTGAVIYKDNSLR